MVDNKRGEGPGSFLATDLVTKATYRLGAAALAAGAVMLLYDPAHGYQLLTVGAAAIGARLGGHLDSFLDRPPGLRAANRKTFKPRTVKELPTTIGT
jgi:hypothetical protein